jgi:hypothetical protein
MHLRFEGAVERLGMSVDAGEEEVNDVPVDGVRLGDRLGEMRKPGTSFYGQSYVEARSAARLMAALGLAAIVQDVRRLEPPAPDVQVLFNDGGCVFIEQTMVMDDDARRATVAIEEVNATVNRVAETDSALRGALDAGLLTIRLRGLTPQNHTTIPVNELAAEVAALARSIRQDLRLARADPITSPLLYGLDAMIFYRLGLRTAGAIQLPMDHARIETFAPALRERLRAKSEKARHYKSECRPLWLLLDVDHNFALHSLEAAARAIIASENPSGFDRIVIQQMRHAPVVLELSPASEPE